MSDPASGQRSNSPAAQAVNGWSSDYVEGLYEKWKRDPSSVDESWRQFFLGFDLGVVRPATTPTTTAAAASSASASSAAPASVRAQQGVDALIAAYRSQGHLAANLDPLGTSRAPCPELSLSAFGLSESDLQREFVTGTLPLGDTATLGDILSLLQETYCRSIGAEFGFISCPERRAWLQERMESTRNQGTLSPECKHRLLGRLLKSDVFEEFLATRYIGKKRFGLEGGDALLVVLDQVFERAAQAGAQRCILGMAHRGRVNVLHNVASKPAEMILSEFDELWHEHFVHGGGDVKYHLGFTGDYATERGGTVRVSICANPSHLEFVGAVATGRARAVQERLGAEGHARVLPLLIHGDAALP
ncbi:MAG: 2-oxoglutarate dehydrogenase E1 component, partial [Phycisphaerae bacterium]|nr:2-oxoglutarate dehydrogenase E1 component [Phycisphaerae bacterium]